MFDTRRFESRLAHYREAAARPAGVDPVRIVDGSRGKDLSAWGLANAVTHAAEDQPDYDRATELEKLGGRVVELKLSEWAAMAVSVGRSNGRVILPSLRLLATRNSHHRRMLECLEYHAVTLGQLQERFQLFRRCVAIQVKAQSNFLKTDRYLLADAQGTTEIEIAFGSDGAAPERHAQCGGHRPEGHAGTADQGLQ